MISSHNMVTKPHHIMLLQYIMTKLHNIKIKVQEKKNKNHRRKLWLSIKKVKKEQTVTLYLEELYARQQQGNKALLM